MNYDEKMKIKGELSKIFLDTEKYYKENYVLQGAIECSRNSTKVYHENFRTNKYGCGHGEKTKFVVNRHKTFQDVKEYIDSNGKDDKIAVLNFANATHAGGAVRSGSRAQEESLCRCSTLYPCINTYNEDGDYKDYVYDNYYKYNGNHQRATARVIYTPDVIVFKSDDDFPSLLKEEEWYKIDVITCAANNQKLNELNDEELYQDVLAKAHNIYNAAIDNNVDVLVLGAFGCGAFRCDPEIVARAFYDAYRNYRNAFKEIRFAIFCTKEEIENYNAFNDVFDKKINYKGYDKKLKYLDLNKDTIRLVNKNNLVALMTGGNMGDMGARYLVLDDNTVLYANVYESKEISDDDIYEALGNPEWNLSLPEPGWKDRTCTHKGFVNSEEWIMSYFGFGFFLYMKMSSNFYNEIGKYLFIFNDPDTSDRMAIWMNLIDSIKGDLNTNLNICDIKYIDGDALNTDADILLHQVNLQGVMGGGIAYQIAKRFPNVEKEYVEYKDKELGNVLFVKTDKYVVGNCFSQSANFDTDYDALGLCLEKVIEYMNDNELKSVAIPYKYGCGIANGDWDKVLSIFKDKCKDYELKIYKL